MAHGHDGLGPGVVDPRNPIGFRFLSTRCGSAPPPTSPLHRAETAPAAPPSGSTFHQPYGTFSPSAYASLAPAGYGYPAIRSDRSRLVAGILQILLPGVGRMYLGYVAIGVLQLIILIPTCFIGWLWSIIDGVLILSGFTKLDGYGRVLES